MGTQYPVSLNLRPLIIAGMHRSGTSYVASVVQASGVVLGERLFGATFANVRGHFEDTDFSGFHVRMLAAHGAATSGWTLQNQDSIEQRFENEALELIKARTHLAVWGWKDPRNALFLDFWLRLLPDACFVFIYRKPWEVVDSLFRRGDWDIRCDPVLSARAWIEHNARILQFCREQPQRSFLANVEGIVRNPAMFSASLAERFGQTLAEPQAELFERSLMHTLRRGSFEEHALATYFPRAVSLYQELEESADVKSSDSIEPQTLNPANLAVPVMMQWQYLRSLESNVRLLRFRVDNEPSLSPSENS
jgi:hypothetical protein